MSHTLLSKKTELLSMLKRTEEIKQQYILTLMLVWLVIGLKQAQVERKQRLAVTYTMLRVKMLELLEESEITNLYNLSKDFKTSDYWLSAFLKRYKLSWRRCTKISQKLPEQTQDH
ncbi:2696_t:CDS:2 [Racocetra persica]|uniref:2696_t:CDS:1 n=1 Tax=Racocetra persica TaxID=160502 RepID=A0ACA9RBR1_9GLOM|nr:2696_t:CDS:2 [Racocetra persica]